MTEASIIVVSILAGLVIGRWWALALALPIALLAASSLELEGLSGTEIGTLTGIVALLGLCVGMAARKGLGLLLSHRERTHTGTGS